MKIIKTSQFAAQIKTASDNLNSLTQIKKAAREEWRPDRERLEAIFTPEWWTTVNKGYQLFYEANRKGYTKVMRVGPLTKFIADPAIRKHYENVLNVEVIFANKVNGKYLSGYVTGQENGKHVIILNPQQAHNDYAQGILHEMHHVWEKLSGKDVTNTGHMENADKGAYQKYRKVPSERRADQAVRKWLSALPPTENKPSPE